MQASQRRRSRLRLLLLLLHRRRRRRHRRLLVGLRWALRTQIEVALQHPQTGPFHKLRRLGRC
jgi:hypothetical protein